MADVTNSEDYPEDTSASKQNPIDEVYELRQRVDQLESLVNAYARTFKVIALTIANHHDQFTR